MIRIKKNKKGGNINIKHIRITFITWFCTLQNHVFHLLNMTTLKLFLMHVSVAVKHTTKLKLIN